MTYLLDTNVCIRLINASNTVVINRLANQQPEDIFISTVTQLELYYGAYRSICRVGIAHQNHDTVGNAHPTYISEIKY
ncbi:type II toxin-antitoxin system VapC family toxin [Anabaena sp. CCY 9910]|uniref:type II toxin-antitoxin system VapC family toxin n=1 Tax=Anabaena sp. CCY 9910 TaxID=3103870 RepID=UPI0039E085D3